MITIANITILSLSPPLLAQIEAWDALISNLGVDLGSSILTLIRAILILLVGWVLAVIVRGLIRKILSKTDIDNRLANWIRGEEGGESSFIEQWVSELAYWLIILFTVVGVLNTLELEIVSQPLNSLLTEITTFLPRLLGLAALLGLAWILATITKILVTRILQGFRLDERLGQQVSDSQGEETPLLLSETIGNVFYWFIFLVFLPSILESISLQGTLTPIQQLVNKVLDILPNIVAAVLIGAVGWLIAQIVRRVVTNLLTASGVNQIGAKFGLSTTQGRQSLAEILGSIVYILILIPVAITALDALKIAAISGPATAMLDQVLNILPKLFSATIILTLAYVGAQYLAELVTNILTSIGFNNIFTILGITSESVGETPTPRSPDVPSSEAETLLTGVDDEEEDESPSTPKITRTPSQLAGTILVIAIMLVATLTAVDILEIEALTTVVSVFLVIAGQVLVGLIVFAVGLYLANLAFNLITSAQSRQSRFLGHTARIAILILVTAMALQQMGIAPNIVNLAFGLLVGGISVAIALAFGLGGREVAGEQLREWLNMLKQD